MRILLAVGALVAATPAAAEVVSTGPNAFHIRHTVTVPLAPAAAYSRFAGVQQWWNPAHTYSGEASALSLELKPGGCFCETLGGGGVEHLRVAHLDAPKRLVLTGSLGPLLFEAVAGVMDVRFEAGGAGTAVTMTYKAAGFAGGGADKIAPAVDKVLGEQMRRYGAAAR